MMSEGVIAPAVASTTTAVATTPSSFSSSTPLLLTKADSNDGGRRNSNVMTMKEQLREMYLAGFRSQCQQLKMQQQQQQQSPSETYHPSSVSLVIADGNDTGTTPATATAIAGGDQVQNHRAVNVVPTQPSVLQNGTAVMASLSRHNDHGSSTRESSVSSPAELTLTSSFGSAAASSSLLAMSDSRSSSGQRCTTEIATEVVTNEEEANSMMTMASSFRSSHHNTRSASAAVGIAALGGDDDHGTATSSKQTTTIQGSRNHFPLKLHEMLDDAEKHGFEHLICWSSDGKSFRIHHHYQNATTTTGGTGCDTTTTTMKELVVILGKYFRLTKYKSFLRQIQTYEFKRVTFRKTNDSDGEENNKGSLIFHPQFQRGQYTKILSMKRKEAKRRLSSAGGSSSNNSSVATAVTENANTKEPSIAKDQQQQREEVRPYEDYYHNNSFTNLSFSTSRDHEEAVVMDNNNNTAAPVGTTTMQAGLSRTTNLASVAADGSRSISQHQQEAMTTMDTTVSRSISHDQQEEVVVAVRNNTNTTVAPAAKAGMMTTMQAPRPSLTNLSVAATVPVSRSISMETIHGNSTTSSTTTTVPVASLYPHCSFVGGGCEYPNSTMQPSLQEKGGYSDVASNTRPYQYQRIANEIVPTPDSSRYSFPSVMDIIFDDNDVTYLSSTANHVTPPTTVCIDDSSSGELKSSSSSTSQSTNDNHQEISIINMDESMNRHSVNDHADPSSLMLSRSVLQRTVRPLLIKQRPYTSSDNIHSNRGIIERPSSFSPTSCPCCMDKNGFVTATNDHGYYSKNGGNMKTTGGVPYPSSIQPSSNNNKNFRTYSNDAPTMTIGGSKVAAAAHGSTPFEEAPATSAIRTDDHHVFQPSASSSFFPVVGRSNNNDMVMAVASSSEVYDDIDQGIMEAFIDDDDKHRHPRHQNLNRNDDYHQRFIDYALDLLVDE